MVKRYFREFYKFIITPKPKLNSFLNTLVALAGLLIAARTYYDQQESGPKQQAALDESTKALEAVVKLFKDQKLVLEKSKDALESVVKSSKEQQVLVNQEVNTSKEQLTTLKKQWKEQQERFNQKPKFELLIGEIPERVIKITRIPIEIDSNRWTRVTLTIKNVGNISAFKTNIFCDATPEQIRISDFRGLNPQTQNEVYPNTFNYRGFLNIDIPPFNNIDLPHLFYCYVLVPEGISTFSIIFKVYSSNSEAKTLKVDFVTYHL